MVTLEGRDPVAGALLGAIRGGDLEALERLLGKQPGLASARIADAKGGSRTPLHIWAASSDDVEVLEALLDGGAEIEVQGAAAAPCGVPAGGSGGGYHPTRQLGLGREADAKRLGRLGRRRQEGWVEPPDAVAGPIRDDGLLDKGLEGRGGSGVWGRVAGGRSWAAATPGFGFDAAEHEVDAELELVVHVTPAAVLNGRR
jgi:hypothetical protein